MELRKTLSNGVEVYASTNPHLHSFCATVRIRAGSAYETLSENGITHMMEHCIVRGLQAHFSEDYYVLLSRNGLQFDAYTGNCRTYYQISGIPAGIPMAAEMIRNMFLPVRLSAAEFRIEKGRVLAEMGEGGSRDPVVDQIWEGSTLNRSIYGTLAKVRRFSRSRLNAHMQSILVPGNVQLCLTGCISDSDLAALLEAAEAIPMYAGQPTPKAVSRPKNYGQRHIPMDYPAQVDYLRFAFDADPRKCTWAAIDLLIEILFNDLDALCYQILSERSGMVYRFSSPRTLVRDCGVLGLEFAVDSALLVPAINAVEKAVECAQTGAFDLESKKNAIRARWERMLDSPVELNDAMLYFLERSDSPQPPDWAQVTKEEIMDCARTIFGGGIIFAVYHTGEIAWPSGEAED